MRLELSEAADCDLADLLEYGITTFGLETGRAYYFGFDKAFALLRNAPEAGQVDEATQLGLRRWLHCSHRIFYRISDDMILIVRIIHYARDLKSVDWD